MVMSSSRRPPLGVHLRGPAVWIVWQLLRESFPARIRQLELDPGVHRDVLRQLRGALDDLELGARAYREWEAARSLSEVADSIERLRGGSDAGLENPSQRWVDTSEAATILDCSPRWITALIQQGRLVAAKRGRSWRVDLDSVKGSG
jgi:excisionase family DNA binding protein